MSVTTTNQSQNSEAETTACRLKISSHETSLSWLQISFKKE